MKLTTYPVIIFLITTLSATCAIDAPKDLPLETVVVAEVVEDCQIQIHKCLWLGCGQNMIELDDFYDHVHNHVLVNRKIFMCLWRHCYKAFDNQSGLVKHLAVHTRQVCKVS